jgi:hypothetical protein
MAGGLRRFLAGSPKAVANDITREKQFKNERVLAA